MESLSYSQTSRRTFLHSALAGVVTTGYVASSARAATAKSDLSAGEGVIDITPPVGITLGGFHRAPGNERRVTGVRRRSHVRAIYLQVADTAAVILSIDMLNVSREFVVATQKSVAEAVGISPEAVRVCATHTHTMPTIAFNRQWGDQHPKYIDGVRKACALAARQAKDDLAPSQLYIGSAIAKNANANRTSSVYKTEDQFDEKSTDNDRWLDRLVHVMHFERTAPKRNLLWYSFSAHPTCYADGNCGPDWPGDVAARIKKTTHLSPSLLQGHIGDVAPGGGGNGNADFMAGHLCQAIPKALASARRVTADQLQIKSETIDLPLDIPLLKKQMAQFRAKPTPRGSFAYDWYENFARRWDQTKTTLPISIAAIRFGELSMLFHPSELYSYYGLAIRRGSPTPWTIVVGYSEGYIGYLPDPNAYKRNEYAAIVVPKILNYPPFQPHAARHMTSGAVKLLNRFKNRPFKNQ